ncbi:MAG: transglycosylase domain-containing protein [Kofleriaceae bacterium]
MAVTGSSTQVRRPWLRRRIVIPIAAAGVVALALLIGLFVVYPRVGAGKIRSKLTGSLATKLGRKVTVGAVDLRFGHATIRDVDVRGPLDGDTPLVHIDRIEVAFDTWKSFVGSVRLREATVDGVVVTVRRLADGRDNVRDVIERVRGDGRPGAGGGGTALPTKITVSHGKLFANDLQTGATMLVGDGDATWQRGELAAQVRGVTATTIGAPGAKLAKIDIRKAPGQPPVVALEGGELSLWPKLSLTGIGGKVVADPARAGKYVIDLAGGYGGVPGNLWTAKGDLDPQLATAVIDLEADKFQLERLAPILAKSPVVDYAKTSIDTKLHLELASAGGKFEGEFHLHGLNVGHPMIADKEVHDVDLSGKVAGTFDRGQRRLDLVRGDFVARDLPFSLTGSVAKSPRALALVTPVGAPVVPPVVKKHPETGMPIPTHGPGGIQQLQLRFVVPPIDCQRALDALPKEMVPYMQGYKLRGVFDTDLKIDVDWNDLNATQLGGHVGYKRCRVTDEPKESPKRLKEEFEHYVEVEEDKWLSFVVGASNTDFVPIEQISPNLIKSIMSTEDSAFYFHRGFITSEFRTALIKDLTAGKFKYGASSITMQMVKNVLLYRDKTLMRKLQELFLTWQVESSLTKDRILEIYFNVIEYGPALYGIGPAAKHYFGKSPKDLNPVEAAFFSSILPSPKERYKQYCNGTLSKWTEGKIQRILGIMLKRDRLTQLEYDEALATPLLFVKDGTETEADCLKRTKKVIKNARSTNPMKR